ncbi:hypothetical protein ACHOLT_00950 [Desulfitobacterium sp. Sab5]|uniref:hypothetical protein n=1 Tax=Desulfitobacterium nosdiversum TaxID=3375356 RepID=UPI003CEF9A52
MPKRSKYTAEEKYEILMPMRMDRNNGRNCFDVQNQQKNNNELAIYISKIWDRWVKRIQDMEEIFK